MALMRSILKRWFFFVVVPLALVFATHGNTHAAEKGSELYNQLAAAWQARDADRLAELYSNSGTVFTSPAAGTISGQKAIRAYLLNLFTAFPDLKLQVKKSDGVAGEQRVDQWTVSGTWKNAFTTGRLAGAQPTGKSFALDGVTVHQFKDAKLVSTTQFYDNTSLLTQIGAVPGGK